MKVLVSPVSLAEARIVAEGGADILDIKNTKEGSLGAQFPWVIREIIAEFEDSGLLCSATLGDLPFKPGTAALAAFGAAHCGVDYIKAGLHGVNRYDDAFDLMHAINRAIASVNPKIIKVASGYADFRRFNGLHYKDLVRAAQDARSDGVMLDTAIKDGKNLFDALSPDELREFTQLGKAAGMIVALAGSVKLSDLELLAEIDPDIVGIRGAVCDSGNRALGITRAKLEEFMLEARRVSPDTRPELLTKSIA